MLIHSGSVKDILQASPGADELIFRFTDRYSVFDWGQMPDLIPGKGQALARMGKIFFDDFARVGFKTHFLGLGASPIEFRVKRIDVPRGNIEKYQARPEWTLIPLEVIYRFGVPKGSSLLKRSKEYYEGQEFGEPLIDFTTKLERMDRVLSDREAKKLSVMTDNEWDALLRTTAQIGKWTRERFATSGLKLWDGKLEFAFGNRVGADREIVLVDTVGLDEMRLTLDGHTLSKEILRQFYLDTEWYRALIRAKQEDSVRFKEKCIEEFRQKPHPLPEPVIRAVGEVYTGVADVLETGVSALPKIRSALTVIREHAPRGGT